MMQLWNFVFKRIEKEILARCLIQKKVLKYNCDDGNMSMSWSLT